MNIAVKKKSTIRTQKHYVIAALLAIPLLFAGNYLWSIGQAGFSVKKETVVFSEVKRGKFTVVGYRRSQTEYNAYTKLLKPARCL